MTALRGGGLNSRHLHSGRIQGDHREIAAELVRIDAGPGESSLVARLGAARGREPDERAEQRAGHERRVHPARVPGLPYCGEQDREQAPGEAVVEVVDQSGL